MGNGVVLTKEVWRLPFAYDLPKMGVFIWLLTHANERDGYYLCKNKNVFLKAGSLKVSAQKLSDKFGIGATSIRRILSYFENEKYINQEVVGKNRVVSVCGYYRYVVADKNNVFKQGKMPFVPKGYDGYKKNLDGEVGGVVADNVADNVADKNNGVGLGKSIEKTTDYEGGKNGEIGGLADDLADDLAVGKVTVTVTSNLLPVGGVKDGDNGDNYSQGVDLIEKSGGDFDIYSVAEAVDNGDNSGKSLIGQLNMYVGIIFSQVGITVRSKEFSCIAKWVQKDCTAMDVLPVVYSIIRRQVNKGADIPVALNYYQAAIYEARDMRNGI